MSPEQNSTTNSNPPEEKFITQDQWTDLDSAGKASPADSYAARELAFEAAGTTVENPEGKKTRLIKVLNEQTGQLEDRNVVDLAKDYLSDFPEVLKKLNEEEIARLQGNTWQTPQK